ncbi:MAG: hypothetical protein E6F98_03545 [Actinobacteria bacterium]|nr:MAG: hypothetical protein E6F98_03545 [Actinomycetota bacterium]
MRRLVVVLAVVAVLLGGALAAYVVHRLHQSADERGSTTTEYVTTEAAPKPPPPSVPWPTYGLTGERTRAVQLALRPPYRVVWRYQAGSLVEFPPSIGYDRLFFSTNKGTFAAVGEKTGKYAWKYRAHRCVAASPAIGPHAHGTVYEAFLNRPPCNAQSGGHGVDGEVIAFAVGHGKVHWKHRTGPSESSPLLVGNRLYVGDWDGRVWALDARTGKTIWRYRTRGPIKGAAAFAAGRVYVGSYDGHVYCLGAQKGRRGSSGGPTSTPPRRSRTAGSSSARQTARCTRSAPPTDADCGRTRQAGTCMHRPRSGGSESSPARTAGRSTRSTRGRARCAGSSTPEGRSPARPPSSATSSTSRRCTRST